MRHFVFDDPDITMSIYELNELKRHRREFQRLKGYKPPESMDVNAIKKHIEEARRSAGKK